MNTIQDEYQEYAFLSEAGKTEGCATEGGVGAITKYDHLIQRSYEGGKWYGLTFKPYNTAYDKDKDWFQVKGMDSCRRKLGKIKAGVYTREIDATKTHINAMVFSEKDLAQLHDSSMSNKYKIFSTLLSGQLDRQNWLTYITKEEDHRTFTKYLDYIII